MSRWWDRATIDQRIQQVDAGIELGMTATQIALASAASAQTVRSFGNYNGRRFPGNRSGQRHTPNQIVAVNRKKWANDYFRGERTSHGDDADLTEIFGGIAS